MEKKYYEVLGLSKEMLTRASNWKEYFKTEIENGKIPDWLYESIEDYRICFETNSTSLDCLMDNLKADIKFLYDESFADKLREYFLF